MAGSVRRGGGARSQGCLGRAAAGPRMVARRGGVGVGVAQARFGHRTHGGLRLNAASEVTEAGPEAAAAECLRCNEGSWKGILCNLNRDGSPQELPPMYVPDAFREWGETLYEWNTLCESQVADDGSGLTQDVHRQVPLAACESVVTKFESVGTMSTEDVAFATGSEGNLSGNFVVASPRVGVENETASVEVQACFHVSETARVRLELVMKKYLSNESAKYHMNAGRLFWEDRIVGSGPSPLSEDAIDEVFDQGGSRESNAIAETARGECQGEEGKGTGLGLPLGAWVNVEDSGEDLRIDVHYGGSKATVCYSGSELASAAISASSS